MRTHEHYEELCALSPIGQLSAQECGELDEHLRECARCRDATGDFAVILDRMPISETELDEKTLRKLLGTSYRDRFLKRAVAEGIPFTKEVLDRHAALTKWHWPRLRLVPSLAAVAAAGIVILSLQVYRLSHAMPNVGKHEVVQRAQLPLTSEANREKQLNSELEEKIAALENQAHQQQHEISDLESKVHEYRVQSEFAKRELSNITDQLAQAQMRASETQRALAAAKTDLGRARSDKQNLDAVLVDQQIRINDLAAQVKEKEAVAERERQLSAVAKDVRELMAARNLHILDVSDVDGNGRSKKTFGRVFLVEGKELIFYAFDLGDRGNPAKVSFQAWGQLEGHQTAAKNLGVFYIDDHAQKRWVLKVDDPARLSAINSVFVTVEPLGGVNRPTGKKLLYAYLGTHANHP